MHVLIRERHGLDEAAGVEDPDHAPAELIMLSFSDSDLSAFSAGWHAAPASLPTLRIVNLKGLQHPASVDLYIDKTAQHARGILVRLLGGIDYWRYGIEELQRIAKERRIALAVIPGDGFDDPALDQASNLPASTLKRLKTLCDTGGAEAARAALSQLALACGLSAGPVLGTQGLPKNGFLSRGGRQTCAVDQVLEAEGRRGTAVLVSYRSFLAAADTAPLQALHNALEDKAFRVVSVFVPSLKDPESAAWLSGWLTRLKPEVIVNATAFSGRGDGDATPFDVVDAPVMQVALAGSNRATWHSAQRGLSPADLAMHVVLPEVDGRIFAGAVSFKEPEAHDKVLGIGLRRHVPDPELIGLVAERAAALSELRQKPNADTCLALILSTYPGREDQTAHAVGLDAPQSALTILSRLAQDGFRVGVVPVSGEDLIAGLATHRLTWSAEAYRIALGTLPQSLQDALIARWGLVPDEALSFPAINVGSVMVALQPERGTRADRAKRYHDPNEPPCHAYVAFHLWLRHALQVDALIHLGAHGTLEWLPGKSVALSPHCWPSALIGALPVIYPFVVNDPGEAAAAKRRISAVTVGHIPPPLISGGVPAGLSTVERLLDEYATADGLDPRRRERLMRDILNEARASGLDRDAGLDGNADRASQLAALDAFVCDIKASQFPDGLHVFGEAPHGADADVTAAVESEMAGLMTAISGCHLRPGPSGSPWRGRRDVLPTGRNLYTIDPRTVPTRSAFDQGQRLADALLTRHLQDQGEPLRTAFIDLWGSATMRTSGESFAMALVLIGVRPIWDASSGRVSGFEITTPAALGRPRVDVTLRMSGLFRDVFPSLALLFEQAIAALSKLDEPFDENPLVKQSGARVYGPKPGTYGLGLDGELDDLSPAGTERTVEAWISGSQHAYGASEREDRGGLLQRVGAAEVHVGVQDLPETDILNASDNAAHTGGFAATARALGASPALIHVDTTRHGEASARPLTSEIARIVRSRAANPAWIAGQMRHGYRGAAALAGTLDQMAAFSALAGATHSHLFDAYFEATLGNEDIVRFLEDKNPAALAAMRQRFRDLVEHGHWKTRRNSVVAEAAE